MSDATALAPDDKTLVQDDTARARSRDISLERTEAPAAVPGFEFRKCLGEGSFGSVWLAREVRTGRQVAIKFYTHRRGLDWSLLSREVEKLAVLYTSRDIVRLLDVGWDHDPPYFVMEFLEQGSLADRLIEGPLPVGESVRIAKAVLRALVHAHGSGILHCDLKPANILLDRDQQPRLADFGQSRLSTEQSPALGTLFYMAPEQADLQAVADARWDVYALGAVLYHMLTGAPPYRTLDGEIRIESATTLEERLAAYRAIIAAGPRPDAHHAATGVDKRLAEIVDRCLHPDSQQRYPNAQVVLDQLEQREQARAKRPLIILGFLGPILFLLAMLTIAEKAVPAAVQAARENLIDRALASDVVAAQILSLSVQQELAQRQSGLEDLAARPELRELIRASHGRTGPQLRALLEESTGEATPEDPFATLIAWKRLNDQRLARAGRTSDESWFVTDAVGRQVFRQPATDSIGDAFHWRDYFHALGKEMDRDISPEGIQPRTEAGISLPFRSTNTGQYMVAIAVPVWNEAHDEVLGVLARTLHLTELLRQWEIRIRQGRTESLSTEIRHERFLALADTRGGHVEMLDHPWMSSENLKWLHPQDRDPADARLRFPPEQAAVLLNQSSSRAYYDPIQALSSDYEGPWLAAFSPVGDTGWTAIVQERRDSALKAVDNLTEVFRWYGMWAVGIFSIMLVALWYFINRAAT